VEFLCHDISVHVPHHVSSKIPWYNLRKANDSLKQNWGEYMTSCTFNWRMMKTIFTGAARAVAGWACQAAVLLQRGYWGAITGSVSL
jgi:fatty acid desaturase